MRSIRSRRSEISVCIVDGLFGGRRRIRALVDEIGCGVAVAIALASRWLVFERCGEGRYYTIGGRKGGRCRRDDFG
jgi:hypothetical protein